MCQHIALKWKSPCEFVWSTAATSRVPRVAHRYFPLHTISVKLPMFVRTFGLLNFDKGTPNPFHQSLCEHLVLISSSNVLYTCVAENGIWTNSQNDQDNSPHLSRGQWHLRAWDCGDTRDMVYSEGNSETMGSSNPASIWLATGHRIWMHCFRTRIKPILCFAHSQ